MMMLVVMVIIYNTHKHLPLKQQLGNGREQTSPCSTQLALYALCSILSLSKVWLEWMPHAGCYALTTNVDPTVSNGVIHKTGST